MEDQAARQERSPALFAAALVISGALLGGVLGLGIAGLVGAAEFPTMIIGAVLFAMPAILGAVLWIRAGALGVPTRTPYLPGDRFHGWTVLARRDHVARFDEYEVRRGSRSAYLTVADTASNHDRWSPTANSLLHVESGHLARPADTGTARGRPYLLLDRSDGQPLTELLDAPGTVELTYDIAVSVMSALRDLHESGLAHGAVHPDNVLVGEHGVLLCAVDRSAHGRNTATNASGEPLVDWFTARHNDIVGWAGVLYAVATGRLIRSAFATPVTPEELSAFPRWLQPVVAEAVDTSTPLAPSASDIVRNLAKAAAAHGIGAVTVPVPRPAPDPPTAFPARVAAVSATTILVTVALAIVAPMKSTSSGPPTEPFATTGQPTRTTTEPTSVTGQTTTSTATSTATSTTTSTTTRVPAAAERPPSGPHWTMPNLVGGNLQAAQDRIQAVTGDALFFTSSHDATGAGRQQVLDANWTVCTQNVPAGTAITPTSTIDFGVVRNDESCP